MFENYGDRALYKACHLLAIECARRVYVLDYGHPKLFSFARTFEHWYLGELARLKGNDLVTIGRYYDEEIPF